MTSVVADRASAGPSWNWAPGQPRFSRHCVLRPDLGCPGLPAHPGSATRACPGPVHLSLGEVWALQLFLLWWPSAHWAFAPVACARGTTMQMWLGAEPVWEKRDCHWGNALSVVTLVDACLIPTTTLEGKCNPYFCFAADEGIREGKFTQGHSTGRCQN